MVVGGYFWLRPWEKSVELGHRYDVPVYASLDGSRISDKETILIRRSDDAYRAHAANAWQDGVDGIYVFNLNYMRYPHQTIWRELGDPQALQGLDKIYHVSVMGTGAPSVDYYVPNGGRFLELPRLCPNHPLKLFGGQRYVTTLKIADDVSSSELQFVPRVSINLKVTDLPSRKNLLVSLNDTQLTQVELTWQFENAAEWLEYLVDPRDVKQGPNSLGITFDVPDSDASCTVHDVHLRLEFGPNADRRRDLTMSRHRFLAYHDSTV